ncbi:MAG: proline--tRNA ligase [Planctomycetota bacterium]|jgi:prolyl-tRNA synthetase
MRWTATLIPTLKEEPAEAVARSHSLMLRAGLIRQVATGSYAYLPLGIRVLRKVMAIVREEMDRAGAIEVQMPLLWPQELMQKTGRLAAFAEDLVRFTDRHGRPHVLAPTHEEVATGIVRDGVRSYRQLPVILYQVHTKLRDEPRPRLGVVRTREFMMKDAYSFSADEASLDECYESMCAAYRRVFERCGLECVFIEADPGAMGGRESHEFMVPTEVGTGSFVQCASCGYAASVEIAAAATSAALPPPTDEPELRTVDTPGRTTIEGVGRFLDVGPERMIKTLLYVADDRTVAALVRGDHEVNEAKLRRELGADSLELADAEVIQRATGAPVGFAGPVGLAATPMVIDNAVASVRDGVVGANEADRHLIGVVPGRDFPLERLADIRFATAEDGCPRCGEPIQMQDGIEVGHVFKLGTKYSRALGARYLGPDGRQKPYVMGCYGIGVNRIAAALIEGTADDRGIVWPPSIAPYEVLVLPLDMSREEITDAAESAYRDLMAGGLDVLLDDRDERPGVKFKDADLIGIPLRVVVGKRYLGSGDLELQLRRDDSRVTVPPGKIVEAVRADLAELRAPAGTCIEWEKPLGLSPST